MCVKVSHLPISIPRVSSKYFKGFKFKLKSRHKFAFKMINEKQLETYTSKTGLCIKFYKCMKFNQNIFYHSQVLFVLFDLILYVSYQQSFSYVGTVLPGMNQY